MRRLAETFGEGIRKGYKADNWQRGFPNSVYLTHAMDHLVLWMAGDKSEDHVAHACWNLMGVMYNEEMLPEMLDYPIRQYEQVTPSTKDLLIFCPRDVGTIRTMPEYVGKQLWQQSHLAGRCIRCGELRANHYSFMKTVPQNQLDI